MKAGLPAGIRDTYMSAMLRRPPELSMSFIFRSLLVLGVCLTGLSDAAQARHRHHHRHVFAPMPAPAVVPAPSPGLNTSVVNQPGVPNTSRPGTIGTGAVPSGLNGDSPTAPGFPGKVGRD
jgi:hypothetical protein